MNSSSPQHQRDSSPQQASPVKNFTLPPLTVKTYMNSPIESPRNIPGGKLGLDMSLMSMTTPDIRGMGPSGMGEGPSSGNLTVKKARGVNQSFDAAISKLHLLKYIFSFSIQGVSKGCSELSES